MLIFLNQPIGGLQPIPRDPKDNGVAAMLDDRTFCFLIQHGRHTVVFLDIRIGCKPPIGQLKGSTRFFFFFLFVCFYIPTDHVYSVNVCNIVIMYIFRQVVERKSLHHLCVNAIPA